MCVCRCWTSAWTPRPSAPTASSSTWPIVPPLYTLHHIVPVMCQLERCGTMEKRMWARCLSEFLQGSVRHVFWGPASRSPHFMRSCDHAIKRSCGQAVMRSCEHAMMRSSTLMPSHCVSFMNDTGTRPLAHNRRAPCTSPPSRKSASCNGESVAIPHCVYSSCKPLVCTGPWVKFEHGSAGMPCTAPNTHTHTPHTHGCAR